MKNFLVKSSIITIIIIGIMIAISYYMDPSNLFDKEMTGGIASNLLKGNIVEINGNYEERLVQQEIAKQTKEAPDTLILGSSHVVYIPLEKDENIRNTGISACELWDLYGIVGMYEYYDIMPKTIIIGVDPWVFNDNSSGTRYKEINGFVEYEKKKVLGKMATENVENSNRFTNLKELVSVSYFQSAFRELRRNGIYKKTNQIEIAKDTEVSKGIKICSNGTQIPSSGSFKTEEQMKESIHALTNGASIYHIDNFEKVSSERKLWFERLISYLQAQNVTVILYMPVCYPTEVYEYVATTPKYDNVLNVEKYLLAYADTKELDIYGSYNPGMFECQTSDFVDELHLKPEKILDTFVKRNIGK